jgi:Regulator of chromosome condensation (RCC1) repeat
MAETLPRPHRAAAFVWGYNNSGGLGLGHSARAYQPVPAQLPPLPSGDADLLEHREQFGLTCLAVMAAMGAVPCFGRRQTPPSVRKSRSLIRNGRWQLPE